MVDITLVIAVINIILGLLIIIFPAFLRVLVGGYFLLVGLIMIIGYLI